jgi:hypothetical protein
LLQDLLGDEGVQQCRSLLDGLDGQASDAYLQQVVTEGRCVVCKHSTFEEDMQAARGDNGECSEVFEISPYLCTVAW